MRSGFCDHRRPAAGQVDRMQMGGDDEVSKSLRYLKNKFREAEAWQIHAVGKKDYETDEGIRVAPALTLLKGLV